jgi:hypothetical protein
VGEGGYVKVVCLCGSTRFREAFEIANMDETLRGNIVISVGMFGHTDHPSGSKHVTADGDETQEVKKMLDELHLRKIDLSSEVLIVNVGDYIGSSTRREIEYAYSKGKVVRFMFDHTDDA